jgi:hypothetical protein
MISENVLCLLKKISIKRQDSLGVVIEPLFIIESDVVYSREFYLACSEANEVFLTFLASCFFFLKRSAEIVSFTGNIKSSIVKPHRYKILIDEINFSSDNIYNLTYKLCHTFFKHKKCVEYPSCLYYANLLVKYLWYAKHYSRIAYNLMQIFS